MKAPGSTARRRSGGRRASALTALVVLQGLCAIFFAGDVLADFRMSGLIPHTVFEALVALALVLGTLFTGWELRRTLEAMRRAETALAAASGALGEVIVTHFEEWGLTAAESEVALLALKGFDGAEIAGLRGSAGGTVRAQLARVYSKAGVSNRSQLIGIFVEELLGGPLRAARDGEGG